MKVCYAKKLFAGMLCLLLLTACGSGTETSPAQTSGAVSTETAKSAAQEKTDDAAEQTESVTTEQTIPDAAASETSGAEASAAEESDTAPSKLLYMGQASIRITTDEGKVIYIDPYVGDGYEPAADLILVTHGHYDHNGVEKVTNRNDDCQIITWKEALKDGAYQTFDLGYVTVEAVEAGYNNYHDVSECVGYVLTLADGVSVYLSGDTSTTKQMPLLAEKQIDYAFYCCDGIYNMDLEEAAACANTVGAKHNIPYHMIAQDGVYFDRERAEQFPADNLLVVDEGEEIELLK